MYNFNCDYLEGVHPDVMKALEETNMVQQQGYCNDKYTHQAKELIKKKIFNQDIYFLYGSTACDKLVVKTPLRPFESVIACDNARINTLETSATEDIGHKIEIIKDEDGLLIPEVIDKFVLERMSDPAYFHKPIPRIIYITNPSEFGTTYTEQRLIEIGKVYDKHRLCLFADGARLAHALVAKNNDLTLKEICDVVDATYVGGTKCDAMFGEALILNNDEFKLHLKNYIKGSGMLIAKSRFLGTRFRELSADDLIFKLTEKTGERADEIRHRLQEQNYELATQSTTNTVFVNVDYERYHRLKHKYNFCEDYKTDDYINIRACTPWSTEDRVVDELIKDLQRCDHKGVVFFIEIKKQKSITNKLQ